ncbi:MAG: M3 family metallopeptidase [Myxococcales bacterium]|nr:M3 family metallopeptidase [Myxococcales bacterium]
MPAPTVAPPADNPLLALPLLAEWQGPYDGVPPWALTKDVAAFGPAIDEALKQWLAEVDAIAKASDPPTFDNTLAALERSGKPLDRVTTLFFTLASSLNTPEVQKLSGEVRPKLSKAMDSVYFNGELYRRVDAVYQGRAELTPEQQRVVEKSRDAFVRRGASLPPEAQARLGAINARLETLFNDFGNRVQADEDTWVVLKKEDLAGLTPQQIGVYEAAAKERKLDGYAVVNTRSAVDPFLTFADDRALREKVWRAFVMRGDNGNANDTKALIQEIVALRAERAKVLGFASHAHWRMADTMAKEPARALALMEKVWPVALKRVREEVRDMQKLARAEGAKITIEPWDYRYYMEKVRRKRFDLDQNELKAYFELDSMVAASYYMAERLYGYGFREITGTVPTFHPDQRVFEVIRKADGSHVGLLYRDDFARQYKRSGAWMTTYRRPFSLDSGSRPIVSNNNNFTKAAAGEPILISLDDARTLFHEFGHALHYLSMKVTYPSLSETPRDFVEFPSQVHENWVLTEDVLDKFARHSKTKERMPQALLDKVAAARTFNEGFATVEYLSAALVDMKLHMDPQGKIDAAAFEKNTLAALGMPKEIVLRHRLPQFNHLFTSDDYSAGYYSYLWSDVMAADAWMAFEEKGDPWHPETAKKFVDLILATGDAIDRNEAYRAFRGRDPKVEALLKNRGFL